MTRLLEIFQTIKQLCDEDEINYVHVVNELAQYLCSHADDENIYVTIYLEKLKEATHD